jgi:bifunctional non-homologous end joining protein LigD
MHFSNENKIYWPKQKYTKGDLIRYYQTIAPYIIPYLKNRPVMILRYPDGIDGTHFVQKDTSNLNLPDWIETVTLTHEKKNVTYFLIQNKATLEYVVNLGTIEFHPFTSRIDTPDYPDYFVLDLDPEDVTFNKVMQTALTIHDLFDEWNIPHYCKTSGGRGLHIVVPLGRKYTYEQVGTFGTLISVMIHEELPQITSLERKPTNRQKKIYLDVLQNHYKQTVVAPYSVRGKPFAPVSTPLDWDELAKGTKPTDFTIKTVPERVKDLGDIFAPILKKGFKMEAFLKRAHVS